MIAGCRPALFAVALVACLACGRLSASAVAATRGAPPASTVPDRAAGIQHQSPGDFPPAAQSLSFGGPLAAQVSNGRPNSCGWGTGPTGPEFGFGVYFQRGDAWYLFSLSTDATVQPYRGPGTYSAKAWLTHVDPQTGPARFDYQGIVQLVVRADTAPDSGTVAGSVSDASGRTVTVNGGWTCTPGRNLGPG